MAILNRTSCFEFSFPFRSTTTASSGSVSLLLFNLGDDPFLDSGVFNAPDAVVEGNSIPL